MLYSSGITVDRLDELDLDRDSIMGQSLLSKQAIEELVRTSGFKYWTILRGTFFMANFLQPKIMMYPGFVESRTWTTALTAETRMPMVDCDDIARVRCWLPRSRTLGDSTRKG